jgi:hypothetical protein
MLQLTTALSNQVTLLNKVNALLLAEIKHIYPQLLKYVGKKIVVANGHAKAFKIDFLIDTNKCKCNFDITKYSMWLEIKTFITNDNGNRTYYEKSIYLGEVKDNMLNYLDTLDEIIKRYELLTIHNVVDNFALIANYKELKTKLDAIESNFKLDKNLLKY